MTHPPYLREKARELRVNNRMSLDEIAECLALGKTTVWYWIRDLPGPAITYGDTPRRRRARERAVQAIRETAKAKRDLAYKQGWDEFASLDAEPGFRDFVCLYIAEGYKRNRNRVSVSNSDPRVVRLCNHWIRRFAQREPVYYFQHHSDQDPKELIAYWASLLDVDKDRFRFQRKSNSGQLRGRKWRSKWGVLAVTVDDTQLRARLQAWIDRVADGWIDSR